MCYQGLDLEDGSGSRSETPVMMSRADSSQRRDDAFVVVHWVGRGGCAFPLASRSNCGGAAVAVDCTCTSGC